MTKYLFSTMIVGILAILISFMYLLNLWFSFEFLGVEQGSQTELINVWAIINMALGVIVLSLSVNQLSKRNNRKMNYLLASTNFILFINMLPLFMWKMVTVSDESLRGTFMHLVICVISFIAILGILRSLKKEVIK